jgi:hypothetical protein
VSFSGDGSSSITKRAAVQLAIGVVLIAVMIWGPGVFGMLSTSGRLDESLAGVERPVDVRVDLDFKPQAFHTNTLQQHGVFGGKPSDKSVRLFQVTPDSLTALSRLYWIVSITRINR